MAGFSAAAPQLYGPHIPTIFCKTYTKGYHGILHLFTCKSREGQGADSKTDTNTHTKSQMQVITLSTPRLSLASLTKLVNGISKNLLRSEMGANYCDEYVCLSVCRVTCEVVCCMEVRPGPEERKMRWHFRGQS